jgi:hypothetical protein
VSSSDEAVRVLRLIRPAGATSSAAE